jgi:hypothetical protein
VRPSCLLVALAVGAAACGPSSGEDDDDREDRLVDAGGDDDPDGAPVGTPIQAILTADRYFAFAVGGVDSIANLVVDYPAPAVASDIFACPLGTGPERFDVPVDAVGEYLNVVAGDDGLVTQGLIGRFLRGDVAVATGDPRIRVCATGVAHDWATAPTVAAIEAELVACNTGVGDDATTSSGWVDADGAITGGAVGVLAVGEDNTTEGGAFAIACQADAERDGLGVGADAHWIWYTPSAEVDAFYASEANARGMLIFRLAIADLLAPAP